eukprot:CAMPEP_0202941016 /NCGR_PEP_ID=MMETSP1395-20130829/1121_1 /ASSEMBLY_ACC=CAM_ASM_000871 /TAXON_ID=5961 /ORGANISM="Blepharisma japonicum, Strain Stock R1072" /LENGTH=565 /DNA_ID=CAMNT_0049635847 /DNA_START=218 /DNA_END=1913 /DNA_ORIENTATION=+
MTIGYPISSENPAISHTILNESGYFKRDLKKAISYFKKANQKGSADSAFFLAFLLQQTLLVEDFDKYLPEAVDIRNVITSLYLKGLERGSHLVRAALAASHKQCLNSRQTPPPSFLKQNITFPFYSAPVFNDRRCGGSCEEIGGYALAVASETLSYIDKNYIEERTIGRLDMEEQNIYGKDTERALMLANKKYDESSNYQGYASLGNHFLYGNPQIGIERNIDQAIHYYEKAAEQNNVQALENLGMVYSQGNKVKKDTQKAIEYLEKAISLGSSQALHTLGMMHLTGNGVEKDIQKALEYFESAAKLGNLDSLNSIGVLYMNGEGVKRDYLTAGQYFQAAASFGHAPALFNLGVMYFKGLGVQRNCQLALELFQKVREKGELAQIILRAYTFYKSGDIEGAYLTYMLGAALGFENAQLSLGYMWEKDLVPLHCKYDKTYCAASYYTQAAQMHQSPWAFFRLGDLSYYGSQNIVPNYEEAYEFYEKAMNIPEAEFNKAYMLEYGIGVDKDLEKAEMEYQKIVEKAVNGEIEYEAMYPAEIALHALKWKQYLKEFPIFDSMIEVISE